MMQRPSDEMLVAYLDGEVDETDAVEVESWLERDPELRARLQALTESATQIRDAFEEILREPVPQFRVPLKPRLDLDGDGLLDLAIQVSHKHFIAGPLHHRHSSEDPRPHPAAPPAQPWPGRDGS